MRREFTLIWMARLTDPPPRSSTAGMLVIRQIQAKAPHEARGRDRQAKGLIDVSSERDARLDTMTSLDGDSGQEGMPPSISVSLMIVVDPSNTDSTGIRSTLC
jgi:hypothetical protein